MSDNEKRRSDEARPQEVPWYERAFGEFYADLYAHRSPAEVIELLGAINRTRSLEGPALDVACGGGRLVRELAASGLSAVGVDLSLPLLRRARGLGTDLQLARSDMRSLPVRSGYFASVFFLFTSFGYFDDPSEDEAVLQGAARALRPGGWLVLDFLNPRPTLAGLVADSIREVRGMEVRERRRYVAETRQIKKSVEVRDADGIQLEYEESVRVYDHSEFVALFSRAGLRLAQTWGEYGGEGFDAEHSPRMIFHAQKGPAT